MTRCVRPIAALLSAALLLAAPAAALELGAAAPPLKVSEWLKGKPIDLKEGQGKTIYLIDFWSPDSKPCENSIPHLSSLQKKYKDRGVVIVGVVGTADAKQVEGLKARAKEFMKKLGPRMDYAVAFDDNNATYKAYLGGFGRSGIPQCFLVDKESKVVWEGHPLFGTGPVIDAVLTGKYDPAGLAEIARKAKQDVLKKSETRRETGKKATDLMNKVEQYFDLHRTGIPEDLPRAKKLGEELLRIAKDEPKPLNDLAWRILTEENLTPRDLDLALKAAQAAVEASGGEDPGVLDTYARALWDNGRKEEAIQQQKKAVELAKDPKAKAALEATLRKYEAQLKKKP